MLAALEHHVLEDVRRAGGPRHLIPGPHVIGHLEGHDWSRMVGLQQHIEPVRIQPILIDAVERLHIGEARDGRGSGLRHATNQHQSAHGGNMTQETCQDRLLEPAKVAGSLRGGNFQGNARRLPCLVRVPPWITAGDTPEAVRFGRDAVRQPPSPATGLSVSAPARDTPRRTD